jgi:DNA repair protein RAD5
MVVLEEGHVASNPATIANYAVCHLSARYRILLTGTPLMNEYTEAQGILRFLKVRPWDDYSKFCKVNS